MNRLRRFGVPLALACLVPMLTAAAKPAADDAAILPYIDEGTFLIGRLDVERVDQEAFGKSMEEMFKKLIATMGIPPDQQGLAMGQMMGSITTAKAWLTDMAAANAKHVYILLDVADLRDGGNDDPAVVIPLGPDADAVRVREILTRNGGAEKAEEVGKAIVYGEEALINRLKNRVASGVLIESSDFAAAFAAAGADVPLRFAMLPRDSALEWIEEKHPKIPEQVVPGGADIKLLTRGVRYMSIGMTQKPSTLANLTIRCKDAEKAKAVNDVLEKSVVSLKEHFRAGEGEKQAAALKPKLTGDTITVSADPFAVQMALTGVRVESEIEVDDGKAAPAQPPKKDDGGL